MSGYGYHTEFVINNLAGGETRLSHHEGDEQEFPDTSGEPAAPRESRVHCRAKHASSAAGVTSGAKNEHPTTIDSLIREVIGSEENLRATPFGPDHLQVRSSALVAGDIQ